MYENKTKTVAMRILLINPPLMNCTVKIATKMLENPKISLNKFDFLLNIESDMINLIKQFF